jgi:hypothetical protein
LLPQRAAVQKYKWRCSITPSISFENQVKDVFVGRRETPYHPGTDCVFCTANDTIITAYLKICVQGEIEEAIVGPLCDACVFTEPYQLSQKLHEIAMDYSTKTSGLLFWANLVKNIPRQNWFDDLHHQD